MKKLIFSLALLLTGFLFAQSAYQDSTVYRAAIQDAMYPTQSKVYDSLIAITKQNPYLIRKQANGVEYIKVVVWMRAKYIDSYTPYDNEWGFYNTGAYPMWVTVAPQLEEWYKKTQPKKPIERIHQLLGLSPKATYDYFIELWVQPDSLYRPCPDKETDDTACDICFPKDVTKSHKVWINNNRIGSYYGCGVYNQVPWTALGYTYDWNTENTRHIGLSEFIIPPNTNVVIKKIYTNKEYFNKLK